MKKLVMVLFSLVMLATVAVSAQTPTPAPAIQPLPKFEVSIGAGQLALTESGNAVKYTVNAQTCLQVNFRYFISDKFAVEGSYIHDTASVARWLMAHNFVPVQQIDAYKYSALGAKAEYWFLHDSNGGAYAFIGPQYYFSTQGINGALGYTAGVGGEWSIWKGLGVESQAGFEHVQDYIVPVANVFRFTGYLTFRF